MKNLLSHHVRKLKRQFMSWPVAAHLREKHPSMFSFIGGRLKPRTFIGLPLTLVVLVSVINVALLSELAESVMDAEWVVVTDQEFTNALYKMRTDWLSVFLFVITKLANQEAVFIIGGIVSAIFIFRKRYVALVAFWLAMAGMGLSVRYGKTFISRARPSEVAYYEVEHFSFPSGHATTAIALYGLLAYFLYRHYHKSAYKNLMLWGAILLILLIGFSRIYLGVHYLSDVLAGYLLGALWLLVGISLVEVMIYRKNKAGQLSKT